jgi:serine/threonine protein kinase
VNNERHIQITDFGLCGFVDSTRNDDTAQGGNSYWLAPELLDHAAMGYPHFERKFETDIYSFAMVCIEVLISRLSSVNRAELMGFEHSSSTHEKRLHMACDRQN